MALHEEKYHIRTSKIRVKGQNERIRGDSKTRYGMEGIDNGQRKLETNILCVSIHVKSSHRHTADF